MEKWTQPLDGLAIEISNVINETTLQNIITKDDFKAREFHQRGLSHWNRYNFEGLQLAIEYSKKSIKENETFA